MFSIKRFHHRLCLALLVAAAPLAAHAAPDGPDLDLSVQYYSRVLTAEGVVREIRYQEKMLRRPGHVWVERVLPAAPAGSKHGEADEHEAGSGKPSGVEQVALKPSANHTDEAAHEHKHFNYVVLPRHLERDGAKLRLEFVDAQQRSVVAIAPTEYENVNFDGSWANAFFLIDPQGVASLPLSKLASPVASARWHEREKNGQFQRVLWDDKKMIPLLVETGDRAGTYFRRIEVKQQASLVKNLPWQNLKGYAQKEYADFLD